MVKMGREEPVASMDASGACLLVYERCTLHARAVHIACIGAVRGHAQSQPVCLASLAAAAAATAAQLGAGSSAADRTCAAQPLTIHMPCPCPAAAPQARSFGRGTTRCRP